MTPSSKQKHILCILKPSPLFDPHHAMLTDEGYFVYHQENTSKALGQIYYEPPDMILLSAESTDWKSIISKLKDDPVYCHLPLILILSRTLEIPLASVSDFKPDDFFFIEDHPQELLLRIRIRETQTSRTLDTNPLTRLPGNHSIMAAIQNHIDEQKEFALGYVDIDNFKAFNDRYGFARGDDLIRMTGRLLINVIRRLSPKKSFVGHIGGDDFFFITESGLVHESCNQIIQNFDLISSTFANDEDRAKGYIECEDRSGKIRQFPLPTISIAVIDSAVTEISHPGEASSIASEIKKEVKKISGSNFMINRRKRFRKDAG